MSKFKFFGIILSVLGGVVSLLTSLVEDKKTEELIDKKVSEKISKKLEERSQQ